MNFSIMKTYQAWEAGPYKPATEYLQPCDEVDEQMYMYFAEVVSPQYQLGGLFQAGEANHEHRGRMYYMTFTEVGEKYFYLGILPAFKQPKHIAHINY